MTGVVLAGGEGRRLRRDKPHILLGDRTILQRICDVLDPLFPRKRVVISSRTDAAPFQALVDTRPGWALLVDRVDLAGPLAGIHAALTATGDDIFAVGCDMPFLNRRVIGSLAEALPGWDCVVPRLRRGAEPLHAAYARACRAPIEGLLKARQQSILDLFPLVRARHVGEEDLIRLDPRLLSFMNINTEDDLARAADLARGESPA